MIVEVELLLSSGLTINGEMDEAEAMELSTNIENFDIHRNLPFTLAHMKHADVVVQIDAVEAFLIGTPDE